MHSSRLAKVIVLLGAACLTLLQVAFFFLEYQMLGFPDGHLSELDRVRRATYPLFTGIGLLISLRAMVGVLRFREGQPVRRSDWVGAAIFPLIWGTVEGLCQAFLDSGQGGV